MNERQYYLSYIQWLKSQGSVAAYLKQTVNHDISKQSLYRLVEDYLYEHYPQQRDLILQLK